MKQCDSCQKEFTPTRKWQKFCSESCSVSYWNSYSKRIPATLKPHQKETIYKLIVDFQVANKREKQRITFSPQTAM